MEINQVPQPRPSKELFVETAILSQPGKPMRVRCKGNRVLTNETFGVVIYDVPIEQVTQPAFVLCRNAFLNYAEEVKLFYHEGKKRDATVKTRPPLGALDNKTLCWNVTVFCDEPKPNEPTGLTNGN